MDPQSQAFTPYSSNNDTWRLQTDVARIHQIQAEHAERLSRLERRQDDDARLKSVWGNSSPFPSVLSGTPQHGPVQHPSSDQFRSFDDEANNLMSSLHLDAEEEPRRSMGATSRANSVRFDESANQNHFSHSTRPSVDYLSRNSSGFGGLQMTERTSSHKSDGRASSVHSMRSAASGRANSLNLDTAYSQADSSRSPLETPGLAPGLLLLGAVPAIVRCWMNTNFKHDALLYAAVCTGSFKSFLDLRLIQKLGFEDRISFSQDGLRKVELPVYFPEAITHPASSRSSSPAPQLPTLTVNFQVVEHAHTDSDSHAIQIFLGSDTLRAHNADILFSSNSMTLFDDDRSKLSIPLVRPEHEAAFNSLFISSGQSQTALKQPVPAEPPSEQLYLNGLGHASSRASLSSTAASPPAGKYRPPGVLAGESCSLDPAKAGATAPDSEARPASRQSSTSRPALSALNTRNSASDQAADASSQTTTPSRSGTSPAIWGSWRRDGASATPTAAASQMSGLDWAGTGKVRDASYQRRDNGIKVLKPKGASRTFSPLTTSVASPSEGRSRFFDEGRRRDDSAPPTARAADNTGGASAKKENQSPEYSSTAATSSAPPAKTKANPIGGASAFSWLNSGGRAGQWKAFVHHDAVPPHSFLLKRVPHRIPHHSFHLISRDTEATTSELGVKSTIIHPAAQKVPNFSGLLAFRAALALATVTTASSQKRRKLALFSHRDNHNHNNNNKAEDAAFDEDALQARSETSSSPRPTTAESDAPPSPASSQSTSPTLPALPLHMQEGRKEAPEGGGSPSGRFAEIRIDSGGSMSGSENGGNNAGIGGAGAMSSPRDTGVGKRSASPAKRSAADMEDEPRDVQQGSPADSDQEMTGLRSAHESENTQDTVQNSQASTSEDAMMSTEASTPSLQSEQQPAGRSEDDKWRRGSSGSSDNKLPSLDEQAAEVRQITETEDLDEGTRGYVVATAWLQKVLSRTSEGLKDPTYPKDAREGPIGAIDNSSIVPPGGLNSPLKDAQGQRFVPLKAGLTRREDFEVLPYKAWGKIVEWYPPQVVGAEGPTQQVVRYAHNTAEPPNQNIQYELDPPVFTIRKVPQPGQETARPTSAKDSLTALRVKSEQRARGQNSADDAIRFVSSRNEKFQKFLARAKEAAGIPRATKVKVFKLLNPDNVTVDRPDTLPANGLSHPASRSASPGKVTETTDTKLVLPASEFKQMNIGTELEHVDVKDETANDKYNGSSSMQTYALFESCTLVLEEQLGGPGGGEFQSDSKKPTQKSILPKKSGSKPSSTTASGRSSPTPGSMLTRGRARRDGRTRGTVGLTNLGNTCYMNSALQCIRSVEELALYFLADRWKSEVNSNNPLGHGGAMAKQYATLLGNMYSETTSSAVSPANFKRQLGSSAPLFSGYGQQDSQEFLSFLVDAIHEDLNRIQKKPYNENPDSDDSTVRDPQAIIDLGETYRANHKARNDSVAMDLFSGFYKNTMECPACEKVSVTFDPYSLLTVQLPIENTIQHPITFVPFVGKPMIHRTDIDKNATVKQLKEYIASKHEGVAADRLWMCEVYNQKIYKVFEDKSSLAEANIQPNDHLFIFELQQAATNLPEPEKRYTGYSFGKPKDEIPDMDSSKADCFAVPIFSRQKSKVGDRWETILHPLYITVTREEAQDYDAIQKKVLFAVAQQTSRPILTEFNADAEPNQTIPNGDAAEKDESAGEDTARISDRSASSEDGYITVSKKHNSNHDAVNADGTKHERLSEENVVDRFFDPHYVLPKELRSQLFTLQHARSTSDGGLHCASMSSIDDRTLGIMSERVKRFERESSVSSASGQSSTSTDVGEANGDAEESDADDDEDKPDIVLGQEDTLHLDTPTSPTAGSDDTLPTDPLEGMARSGRRKGNGKADKYGKKGGPKGRKGGKLITYGNKKGRGQQRNGQQRPGSSASQYSTQSKQSPGGKTSAEDEAFYIKLGEAIVLDWTTQAIDALFGGDEDDQEEMRGHWLSTKDGRDLEVAPDPVLEAKLNRRATRKKNGITLEDCFAETSKREILSEDNAWYCNRCKEMRQAAKTLEIWTIPDILIVHLKRFASNRSFRDKVEVFVDYPVENLDMTDKIGLKEDGKEYTYDLFAIDNHYGGLGGGHYTATAKNFFDGQWYDYNDSICSKASENKLHSAAAYLLFYRRRSDKPLGPQYLQDLVNVSRNPLLQQGDSDDETGEARLGGPTSSPPGSPSTFATGAETANLGSAREDGGSAPGAAAVSSQIRKPLTARRTGSDDDDDRDHEMEERQMFGPERPPHLQADSQWSFAGLDGERAGADDGDNDSTAPEPDDEGVVFDRDDEEFNDWAGETSGFNTGSSGQAGVGTPADLDTMSLDGQTDDHHLYASGRDTIHVENAEVRNGSPEAEEIHLDHEAGRED